MLPAMLRCTPSDRNARGNGRGCSIRMLTLASGANFDNTIHIIGYVVGEVDASCDVEVHAVEAHHSRLTVYQQSSGIAPFRTVQDGTRIEEGDRSEEHTSELQS